MKFYKKWRFWKKTIFGLIVAPIILFFLVVGIVYWKQDAIVQELLLTLNKDFEGKISIEDSHISPFENFPYISIDLDHLKIVEDKAENSEAIVSIADVYLGFDMWTLLSGKFDIKAIKLEEGYIHAVQDMDGEINLIKALSTKKEIEDAGEEFHMDLKKVELVNIDLYKLNLQNGMMVETFVDQAKIKFKTDQNHIYASINSTAELNVIHNGDTSFFKHKKVEIDTEIDYVKETKRLTIKPSSVNLEKASFNFEGSIDLVDDMNVDLLFKGNKPSFELFYAFAPEELLPTLEQYENQGKIFFDASIKGKSSNGYMPLIDVTFGCENAYFNNTRSNRKLEELNFKGHFTNGQNRDLTTMAFSISNFTAKPEAGSFSANLAVVNFETPDIQLQVNSDFDLDFLAKFLNLNDLKDLKGKVKMQMNFHDIIDLKSPEKSIEELSKSYYSELSIDNLSFSTSAYHLPIKDIDAKITMSGNEAKIEYFNTLIGKSDVSISGSISDLPAIIHHTSEVVNADLIVSAKLIDLYELTAYDIEEIEPVDEQIENLRLQLKFLSSAKAITESPNLPIGEFYIEHFYAKFNHYPHTLHDFHADLIIDEKDFKIIDFSGEIDKSDFHFKGKLGNYDLWFMEESQGDTKVEFDLTAQHLELHDLFSYQGENYVPEDYRHEVLSGVKIHGETALHFINDLQSIDINLTQFDAKMKMHPMKFEKFKGKIHFEDDHIQIQNLAGKIGKSEFVLDLNYYVGEDETIKKRDNHFGISAKRLDFDELFSYELPPSNETITPQDHEEVFNIYDLPFTNMTFDMDIKNLNYHRYLISNFKGKLRTTPDHYVYIDTLNMNLAGGIMMLSGYFNGSDRNKIYFSPKLKIIGMDLDQLMFKFENFGQDELVSENLHGKLTAYLTGMIHMHPDLIPIIDDSEIHMDVTVINGQLVNYEPMLAMQEYFIDKNMNKILFDTLSNHLDMKDGFITIPNMTINSSVGFIEISGNQDMDYNMEYYIRVPLKLISSVGAKNLFGKNNTEEIDPEKEDEIQFKDESKKTRYVNIKLIGDHEDYKISLGKEKGNKTQNQ